MRHLCYFLVLRGVNLGLVAGRFFLPLVEGAIGLSSLSTNPFGSAYFSFSLSLLTVDFPLSSAYFTYQDTFCYSISSLSGATESDLSQAPLWGPKVRMLSSVRCRQRSRVLDKAANKRTPLAKDCPKPKSAQALIQLVRFPYGGLAR